MRNKQKTIESLRRLAERPGSPNEGEIARRLLEQLGAIRLYIQRLEIQHQSIRHTARYLVQFSGMIF